LTRRLYCGRVFSCKGKNIDYLGGNMSIIEVEKVKTEWRAVEFDGSQGSDSYDEVEDLFDWSGAQGYLNCLDEYLPNIEVPVKKPTYPGETRTAYIQHGGYVVANNRGKVEVLTDDEFYVRFKEKE
jgi:hypothetical protein